MSINTVVITGRLGADPEHRTTAKGTSVLEFNVAVNERVSDGNGGWTDRASWVKCVLFGKRADSLAKLLYRGSKVAVSGRLHEERWEYDGKKRRKLSVVVEEIDLMIPRENAAAQGTQAAPVQQAEPTQEQIPVAPQPVKSPSVYDADIPF